MFPFFLVLLCLFFFSPPVPLPVSVSSLSLFSHSPSPLFQTSSSSFLLLSIVSFIFFSFCFLFSFLFFSPSFFFMLALSGIYRAKGSGGVPIAALSLCMGSGVFLPCHDAGLSGQWVWIVGHDPRGSHQWGGVSTRGRNKWERQKFLSSFAAHLGEEGGGTLSLKTTLFCSFFFYMKRRRFEQNAPFHLNKIWRQNTSTSKLVLNLFFVHSRPQMQFWF
jgi:hypothetical protein